MNGGNNAQFNGDWQLGTNQNQYQAQFNNSPKPEPLLNDLNEEQYQQSNDYNGDDTNMNYDEDDDVNGGNNGDDDTNDGGGNNSNNHNNNNNKFESTKRRYGHSP